MHYHNEKSYTQALEYFEKAINADSKYSQAYYNKACTHSLLSQKDKAIADLKKAMEFDAEEFKEKAKKDSDFDVIRGDEEFVELLK